MFRTALILCVFIQTVYSRHYLLDAGSPLETNGATINLVRDKRSRTKREACCADYHLTISTKGRDIHARLKRSDIGDFTTYEDGKPIDWQTDDGAGEPINWKTNGGRPVDYKTKRDWDMYTSDDVDGHFIVHKRDTHSSVEGYLTNNGERYLIQPVDLNGRHVMHTIKRSTENDLYALNDNAYKTIRKRNSGEYVVEVYVVADVEAIKKVKEEVKGQDPVKVMEKYVAMHLAGMNTRFSSLKNAAEPVALSVRSAGLNILTKNISDIAKLDGLSKRKGKVFSGAVNSHAALKAFEGWLAKESGLPQRDYSVLYTGYAPWGEGSVTEGSSNEGHICKATSAGIVRFTLSTKCIRVSTHELGHALGSPNMVKTDCRDSLGVMSVNGYEEGKGIEYWSFSRCADQEIADFLRKKSDQVKCLRQTSARAVNAKDEFYGQEVSPDEQCRHKGRTAFYRKGDAESICQELKCVANYNGKDRENPIVSVEYSAEALPGTSCGDRKLCYRGKCVKRTWAKSLNEKCPFGDDPEVCRGSRNSVCPMYHEFCCDKCAGRTWKKPKLEAKCADMDKRLYCVVVKAEGRCNPPHYNYVYARDSCKKTCGVTDCKPDCEDGDWDVCNDNDFNGLCARDDMREEMAVKCAETCNLCDSKEFLQKYGKLV